MFARFIYVEYFVESIAYTSVTDCHKAKICNKGRTIYLVFNQYSVH